MQLVACSDMPVQIKNESILAIKKTETAQNECNSEITEVNRAAKTTSERIDLTQFERAELIQSIDKVSRKITQKIKAPREVPLGSKVSVEIQMSSAGDVIKTNILDSSGNSQYCGLVKQAIYAASPLPMPENSKLKLQFQNKVIFVITHEK